MANKLELTWYGKDEPILVEPRLLIENAALSNTAADPDTENMLIHGGQPPGPESAGEQIRRAGEVHLHRSAIQRQRFWYLRR